MDALRAWLPRPRDANPLPLDAAIALGLAGLAYLFLQARAGSGNFAGQAAGILGAALLGIYSATVPASAGRSVRGILMAAVAVGLSTLAQSHPSFADLGPLSLVLAVFILTRVQASRQLAADLLRRRAEELERGQEERARTAVTNERARIARELHDVVAHSVGVMVVQAQGAERIMGTDPGAALQALQVIANTGRDAVAEMNRLVAMLRESPGTPPLAPQPSLGELHALVEHAQAAGLAVDLTVEGEPHPLPAGVDLAAYRIVQEALTNVRKHAGDARATVRIHHREQSIEMEIADDGQGISQSPDGSGHGLVGMRERVAIYGGTMTAGARPGGGFAVVATLPIDGARP